MKTYKVKLVGRIFNRVVVVEAKDFVKSLSGGDYIFVGENGVKIAMFASGTVKSIVSKG